MSEIQFRSLQPSEYDQGYLVYLEAFAWLKTKGINQWPAPMARSVYDEKAFRQESYGVFVDGQQRALILLGQGTPHEWGNEVGRPDAWWIYNLAIGKNGHGQSLGKVAVDLALHQAAKLGAVHVHLHCVNLNEFLPKFYQGLGFAELARKKMTYSSGITTHLVLFRKRVSQRWEPPSFLHPRLRRGLEKLLTLFLAAKK